MEIVMDESSLYKNLFLNITYPVILLEVVDQKRGEYRFNDMNEAACKLLDFSKEELLKKDIQFFLKKISAKVRKRIKNLLFSDGEFSTILELPDRNNQMVTVEMNCSLNRQGERQFIFCMLKRYKEPCCFHEMLSEENAYLHTIFNTVQSLVVILDQEGRIYNWNEYAEEMTGYSLEEVQCRPFWEFLLEEEERERIVSSYKQGYIPSEYENYWIMKDGQKRYIKWKSVVHTDYIISTGTDITEQVRSYNALERSKEKYRTLVSSMDDLVFTIDQSLTITSAFGKWMETNGFTKETFEGKKVGEIFIDTNLQEEQCMKTLAGESAEFEWELNLEGRTHYFHSILSPIILKNNVINEIVSVTRNITDKKKLEEHQKRIYEAVTSGVLVRDQSGRIVIANKNAADILGYPEDELVGMYSVNDQWNKANDSEDKLLDVEHPAISTLRTGEAINNLELAIYNPARNEQRLILMDTRPIFELNNSGKVEYVLSTFHDITEKKEMDFLLQQSEKLAVIGQLASGIAHEIRNPLTGIMGFLKLIDESTEKEKLVDYLPVIKHELNHIHRITEEFIELSLPKDPVWTDVDLEGSIGAALEFLKTELEFNQIQVSIERIADGPAKLWGVEEQLKQLFINLFKNAVEAMELGGRLDVKIEKNSEALKISVVDDGKGISPERLKHLGEPYYSIKEKGTGLGLMRCFKITHDHKGKIEFFSDTGQGTKVEIILPVESR
ncbi:PAS domain-containing protein [Mesobacillus subterraneus]|nr:PAS domain-containing sensor histidine kinase [Mesobacillus subterraneus]